MVVLGFMMVVRLELVGGFMMVVWGLNNVRVSGVVGFFIGDKVDEGWGNDKWDLGKTVLSGMEEGDRGMETVVHLKNKSEKKRRRKKTKKNWFCS